MPLAVSRTTTVDPDTPQCAVVKVCVLRTRFADPIKK
jgi:hypothetical protein